MAAPETVLEDLKPDWIGVALEVGLADGVTVGMRLARYERRVVEDDTSLLLYGEGSTSPVTLTPQTELTIVPPARPPALPRTVEPAKRANPWRQGQSGNS
jgi:hypothetical protein